MITKSTQTSPSYTSPNLPLRSRPLKIEINTLKRDNNEHSQGSLHKGEVLHNGFTQPKTLGALSNRLTKDT